MISIETITGSKYIGTSCESFVGFTGNVLHKLQIDESSYAFIPADKIVAFRVIN